MPNTCCIADCNNYNVPNIKFYIFPTPSERLVDPYLRKLLVLRRKAWIKAVARDDMTAINIKNRRVCSAHFISGSKANLWDITNPDWAPNQNLSYSKHPDKRKSLEPLFSHIPSFQDHIYSRSPEELIDEEEPVKSKKTCQEFTEFNDNDIMSVNSDYDVLKEELICYPEFQNENSENCDGKIIDYSQVLNEYCEQIDLNANYILRSDYMDVSTQLCGDEIDDSDDDEPDFIKKEELIINDCNRKQFISNTNDDNGYDETDEKMQLIVNGLKTLPQSQQNQCISEIEFIVNKYIYENSILEESLFLQENLQLR